MAFVEERVGFPRQCGEHYQSHINLFFSLCVYAAIHEGASALLSHLAVYTVVLNLVYNNTQGLLCLESVWVCMSVYTLFVHVLESVCETVNGTG